MINKKDQVYFTGPSGVTSGTVLSHGKHGATVKCDRGQNHKVPFDRILGHKTRVTPSVRVVDQGVDGAIVADTDGRRTYVHGLEESPATQPAAAAESGGWDWLGKSLVLFVKSDKIVNRPGLALQQTTDKVGHTVKRWKKTAPDAKKMRTKAPTVERETRGAASGYGTSDANVGDVVHFTVEGQSHQGAITAHGHDGASVADASGATHQVLWSEITAHARAAVRTESKSARAVRGQQNAVPAADFSAADYAKSHDDPAVTVDSVMRGFDAGVNDKMTAANARLKAMEDTITAHKPDGVYTEARLALHDKIMYGHFLTPERVKAATPAPGEKPVVALLGGRGGSGKSALTKPKAKGGLGLVDASKYVLIDADAVKEMLPEYEGWNAHQVHEESGDILDAIMSQATALGLNLALDETMKTPAKTQQRVQQFRALGYGVEAHYMHLPRQEAAKRAVERFIAGTGKSARMVPPAVVLSNTRNEEGFDSIRPLVDKWSFHDNNVARGEAPRFISSSEHQPMKKSMTSVMLVF